MKLLIAQEDQAAESLIPPAQTDGSGIGVNYADAYMKALNTELEDGRNVTCKRKGLKITFTVGEASGESLMRRLEDGPDVKNILRKALVSAAAAAGVNLLFEHGEIWLDESK